MEITLISQLIRYIQENYMKISENTIDWIYSKKSPLASFMTTSPLRNLQQVFPMVFWFKLVSAAMISSPLVLQRASFLLNWICNLGVRRLDVRGDVVTNVPSSTASSWHLMQVSVLSRRPCGRLNGGITSPSLVTTPNTMKWTGCLVFITISKSCGDRASQWLFYEFTKWSWQKIWKKKTKTN